MGLGFRMEHEIEEEKEKKNNKKGRIGVGIIR